MAQTDVAAVNKYAAAVETLTVAVESLVALARKAAATGDFEGACGVWDIVQHAAGDLYCACALADDPAGETDDNHDETSKT